jgi:hypothetical protein
MSCQSCTPYTCEVMNTSFQGEVDAAKSRYEKTLKDPDASDTDKTAAHRSSFRSADMLLNIRRDHKDQVVSIVMTVKSLMD